MPKILSPLLLFIISPTNAPMQAPNINPIGPRINSPKNNPIPLPKIPFFEPPNFLFINNGKIKSTKKIKIEIKKVKIKNLKLISTLELK